MNKKTKEKKSEKVFKYLVVTGIILLAITLFFGLRYELYSSTELEKNKNNFLVIIFTILLIIDAVPVFLLMRKMDFSSKKKNLEKEQ